MTDLSAKLDDARAMAQAIVDGYANPAIGHEAFRVQATKWATEYLDDTAALAQQALRTTEAGDVEWQSDTVAHLQRAITDDDDEVRERAAAEVAKLYAVSVAPYAAALAMVRDAIGELFEPIASIESRDASLLRGPEPHHEAEAQIAALQRILAALSALEHQP